MSEKRTFTLGLEELPALLRKMADALEGNQQGTSAIPSLDNFRRIKFGVKNEYGVVTAKLKVSNTTIDTDTECCQCGGIRPDGLPKYSNLKKQMKSSFKAVYQSVHTGSLPPEDAVNAFIAESRLMTQYPGYGDEYYEAYNTAVDAFVAAWEAKDIATLHTCVDELNHLKTDCHQRYK